MDEHYTTTLINERIVSFWMELNVNSAVEAQVQWWNQRELQVKERSEVVQWLEWSKVEGYKRESNCREGSLSQRLEVSASAPETATVRYCTSVLLWKVWKVAHASALRMRIRYNSVMWFSRRSAARTSPALQIPRPSHFFWCLAAGQKNCNTWLRRWRLQ